MDLQRETSCEPFRVFFQKFLCTNPALSIFNIFFMHYIHLCNFLQFAKVCLAKIISDPNNSITFVFYSLPSLNDMEAVTKKTRNQHIRKGDCSAITWQIGPIEEFCFS